MIGTVCHVSQRGVKILFRSSNLIIDSLVFTTCQIHISINKDMGI